MGGGIGGKKQIHDSSNLMNILENDIGQLLMTKIQVALDHNDSAQGDDMLLSNLHIKATLQDEDHHFHQYKQEQSQSQQQQQQQQQQMLPMNKCMDIKADYSSVSSRLLQVPEHYRSIEQDIKSKIDMYKKKKRQRQVFQQLISQIMSIHIIGKHNNDNDKNR